MNREDDPFSEEYVSTSSTVSVPLRELRQTPTAEAKEGEGEEDKYKAGKPVRVITRAQIIHGQADS